MNRAQRRAMQLAGTVSVPQKFPQLGRISFLMSLTAAGETALRLEYLVVDHVINAKLRILRSFRTSDVSAVFLPRNSGDVDFENGEWFLGGEIAEALPAALGNCGGTARGIAYVPEQAATLMQVEVGMTAAESVDYYPPLPDDRSVDHYSMASPGPPRSPRASASEAPCDSGFAVAPCDSSFAGVAPCDSSFAGVAPCDSSFAGVAPCDSSFATAPGVEPRKPKKEKEGKKGAKARGKKQGKKRKKKDKKRKKELAALDPRSRIIW
jgi:hypothetical protein